MNIKDKNIRIIALTVALSGIIFATQFFQGKHLNYYVDEFAESMSLEYINDLDTSDGNILSNIGEDPYLLYSLPEQGDYLNSKIVFSNDIADVPLNLYIFYSDDLLRLPGNKRVDVTTDISSNSVCFSLPREIESVKYIRIDFESTMTSAPAVCFVGLQRDSLLSRFVSFLLGLIYDFLFIIPILILLLFYACIYFAQNWTSNSVQRDLSAIIIMVISFFILYFDYLLGDKAFSFYGEAGTDSFMQTYPNLVSQASRIASGIWKEYVNFKQGLGNHEDALVLGPGNWFIIFGENTVLNWMGISHYLKVLLAGILAYFWSKVYSENSETSIIVAFSYAMSSEFTVRGAWYDYPNMALLLIFWLLAFELQHKKGKWYLLPIATVLLFYCNGVYQCLLWGVLLAFYILFRKLADRKDKMEWRRWIHVELMYVMFAILGMTDTLLAKLTATLSSDRFTKASADFSLLANGILSNKHLIFTAFLRTLGQSIMGISDDFLGWNNFLGAPAFYCGIFLALIIPVSIYNMEGRKRFYYILSAMAACLYIVVTPIRILANGVAFDSFKLSSYWICILMLIWSMDFLVLVFSERELKKGSIKIFQITAVAAVAGFWVASKLKYIARTDALVASILFIIIYVIIMQYIGYEGKRMQLKSLCFVFVVETMALSWPVINDRNTVHKDDRSYDNYAVDVLNDTNENNQWYRLEKAYRSVGECDSLVQKYYGIPSYVGGTEADSGIIAIYEALGLSRGSDDYHLLMGTGGNIYASAVLGTRYYLTKNIAVDRYGLQYLFHVGNVSVYENDLALPIAYTYGKTISESEFDQLSIYDRNRNILDACVVDSQNVKVENVEPLVFDFSELSEYQQVYEQSGGTYRFGLDEICLDESQVLIVRMMMSKEGYWHVVNFLNDTDIVISYEIISYGAGEKVLEICGNGLKAIQFPDAMCNDIETIEFYAVDAERYYADTKRNTAELQSNAMTIAAHDEIYNYIEGTVNCEQPRVLATSIPISDSWKILVDGQMTEVITVNKGFVGCYLDEGVHEIVVYYDGKSWLAANIFKVVGFSVSLGVMIIGIYKSHT